MDERLISYLYFFNVKQDYYECHEYGEHLWLELGRPVILKGLIQSAVCLYHLHNGNLTGARRMWARARVYLLEGVPNYEGINTAKLRDDIDSIFNAIKPYVHMQMVSPKVIQDLMLPKVTIEILDPETVDKISVWIPKPLHTPD